MAIAPKRVSDFPLLILWMDLVMLSPGATTGAFTEKSRDALRPRQCNRRTAMHTHHSSSWRTACSTHADPWVRALRSRLSPLQRRKLPSRAHDPADIFFLLLRPPPPLPTRAKPVAPPRLAIEMTQPACPSRNYHGRRSWTHHRLQILGAWTVIGRQWWAALSSVRHDRACWVAAAHEQCRECSVGVLYDQILFLDPSLVGPF